MSNETKYCVDCGAEINIKAEMSPQCGARAPQRQVPPPPPAQTYQPVQMGENPQFHRKTTKERENELLNDYPPTKFNWWAFLFGVLYYAYHGMWGKAVLYTLITVVTAGIGAIPLWFYMGFRHNKHYLEHNNIYIDI